MMKTHAIHIECPEREFTVRFLQCGTVRRATRWREVAVLAETKEGAEKICRSRFPRGERYCVVAMRDGSAA
jgi:hypothetical protein